MIFTDRYLEVTLPFADAFVVGLCSWCKIIGLVYALLMKVYMNIWHPLQVFDYPLLAFHLCLPGPVPIQIKIIVIGSSARPWFTVLTCVGRWIVFIANGGIEPVYVSVPAVGIQAGIHDHNRVFKPVFGLRVLGIR